MKWLFLIIVIINLNMANAAPEPSPDYWWKGNKVFQKKQDEVWREVAPDSVTLKRPEPTGNFIVDKGQIFKETRGVYKFFRNITIEDLILFEEEKSNSETKGLVKFNLKPFLSDKEQLNIILQGLSFAINSINTTSSKIFNPFEAIKEKYKDAIPANGQIELDLSAYLTEKQLEILAKQVIEKDPYQCNSVTGTRPDHFISSVLLTQPTTYYQLVELKDGFSNEIPKPQEFNREGGRLTALFADEGESGIAHKQRAIFAYELNDGRVFSRSHDLSQNTPNLKDKNNWFKNPHGVQADAHEEIGELKNGFRIYSLRNSQGKLQDEAPKDIVFEDIKNPISCFRCHDSFGFRSGKSKDVLIGYEGREKDKNIATENFYAVFGKGQGAIDRYNNLINPSNDRYKKAKEKAGIKEGINGIINSFNKITIDSLLQEMGADPTQKELLTKLLKEKEIEISAKGTEIRKKLENKDSSGKSIFCTLKNKLTYGSNQNNSTQTQRSH